MKTNSMGVGPHAPYMGFPLRLTHLVNRILLAQGFGNAAGPELEETPHGEEDQVNADWLCARDF